MSDLSRQAGFLSATEFFRFFIKTIIGIALARLITPGELGSFRQLFLIYSTFSTLLLLGIPQSMLYFLPRCGSLEDQRKIISRTLNIISLLAVLFTLAILLLRGTIAEKFNNPALEQLLLIYAIYPLFMFITQVFSSIMMGMKSPLRAAKFTIFAISTDAILIMGTAFFTRNLQLIVWAVIASAMLQWLYARIKLWQYSSLNLGWDWGKMREQFAYCLPLGLSTIIGTLSVQLDKFMISGFFSPQQFAVFSLGAMELPLVGILANSIYSVLLPQLSSGNPAQMGSLYSAAVRKNALLVFPITVLFFLFARPIMVFLYGSVYAEAALYFRIYLLALPVRIAIYDILFQASGKTKIIMLNSLLILCCNAMLNYLFIRLWGMQGAAIATVVVTWLSMLLYLLQMKGILKLQLRSFFPWTKIAKTCAAAMLASLTSLPVINFFSIPLLSMFLGGTVFVVVYLLLGRLFGVILDYDLQLISSMLKESASAVTRLFQGKK